VEFPDWMMPKLPAPGAESVSNTLVHPTRAEMFVRNVIRERVRELKASSEEDVASGGADSEEDRLLLADAGIVPEAARVAPFGGGRAYHRGSSSGSGSSSTKRRGEPASTNTGSS
jgi:hypothetical protein